MMKEIWMPVCYIDDKFMLIVGIDHLVNLSKFGSGASYSDFNIFLDDGCQLYDDEEITNKCIVGEKLYLAKNEMEIIKKGEWIINFK